jgi:hypothetical protein
VENTKYGNLTCPKCGKTLEGMDACVYLYRQGSPYGIAGGFGIYINGEAYGHIGNKETLCIPLAYGTYNLHCAVGMSRKCRDLQVTLSTDNPEAYAKVYIKPGFWTNSFVVEPLDPKLLNL